VNALVPLSWMYGAGVALHRGARMVGKPRFEHPRIVSIGNLEAGGNGKTPLALWMLERAVQSGEPVVYVSRGYSGDVSSLIVTCVPADGTAPSSLAGMRILSRTHDNLAAVVGDEGALVIERAPGVTALFCGDKVRAVSAAVQLGVMRVVLDDGFQSWRVARHTDIVLLDAELPLDGGRLLPAGRLRENPDALARAQAIVFNGAATPDAIAAARAQVARWLRPDVAILGMARRIELIPVAGEPSRRDALLAVSAIARPTAFEQSLQSAGASIAGHEIFPDHHRYDARDVERIAQRAQSANATAIVATEKDWVKLRHFDMPLPVWIARLELSLTGDELPV
jgi:tetraacyldisaccharide 4'-kinase